MEVLNQVLEGIEFAFQKHEKEIVIELAADRLLHYIGVYLIILLAALAKVTEIAGDRTSCFPVDNTSKPVTGFIKHANRHCWHFPQTHISKCNKLYEDNQHQDLLVNDPTGVNSFVQCLAYLLLAEAVLLAIPSVWWHNRVGARLIGHLVFVKSFLESVYESFAEIPAGIYRKLPYDKKGSYLDGWRSFSSEYKREHQGMKDNKWEESDTNDDERKKERMPIFEKELTLSEVVEIAVNAELKEEEIEVEKSENEDKSQKESDFICGSIKDRHLFSMLCYENFASLEYHPYIMSVQALTATPAAEGDRRGIVSLQKGIWSQFTHKDNFTGQFLIRSYMLMCIMRIVLATIMFIVMWIVFSESFTSTFESKSFLCDVPPHNACLICVIKGHWDVTALFFVDLCIIAVYFALSTFQFYFVRFGSDRALCYYLEDMNSNLSVAYLSAHKSRTRR